MSSSAPVPGESTARPPVIVLVILAISVALNLALAVVVLARWSSGNQAAQVSVDKNMWYAVALTTNETFVGHISDVTVSDISLQDIYYLQFQATDEKGNPIPSPRPDEFKPVLCKFGTNACRQLYGNQDFIRVSRQNVVYFTELRGDSQIVQAILRYQQGQAPSPARSGTPSTSPHP